MKDPRLDHKTAEIETVEKTEHGKIFTTEHWDGSVDKTVRVKSLKLNLTQGATPDKRHVAAIAALEKAHKEHQLAKNSGSDEWLKHTTEKLRIANERVLEVQ